MYETYYGLSAKPFQLRPDPHFYFGSKGHKRAMAYLEYGLSQGEGFIVITGEVGAGKTTLVRNLFNRLPSDQIVAAHIVNTHVNADDALRMVAAAFGLPADGATKGELLTRIEQFLRQADRQGKRALLVIDEAQNLNMATVEELRMLSNFQTDERCLLQTFLLGQPEFRATLHRPGMQQLRQRVIASYHLGPMDAQETRAYIEHRLQTVGWRGDPVFSDDAHAAIYAYSGGIPRKTNTLCDRILLMGYLEELHAIGAAEVDIVVRDIREEFELPEEELVATAPIQAAPGVAPIDERMAALEHSMGSVLSLLKNMAGTPRGAFAQPVDGAQ
jgi:putative secretion ATPase (PEP-CTERM system associated)